MENTPQLLSPSSLKLQEKSHSTKRSKKTKQKTPQKTPKNREGGPLAKQKAISSMEVLQKLQKILDKKLASKEDEELSMPGFEFPHKSLQAE